MRICKCCLNLFTLQRIFSPIHVKSCRAPIALKVIGSLFNPCLQFLVPCLSKIKRDKLSPHYRLIPDASFKEKYLNKFCKEPFYPCFG